MKEETIKRLNDLKDCDTKYVKSAELTMDMIADIWELQASNEQLRKAFEELLLQTEDPTYWRKRAGLPDKQTKG